MSTIFPFFFSSFPSSPMFVPLFPYLFIYVYFFYLPHFSQTLLLLSYFLKIISLLFCSASYFLINSLFSPRFCNVLFIFSSQDVLIIAKASTSFLQIPQQNNVPKTKHSISKRVSNLTRCYCS